MQLCSATTTKIRIPVVAIFSALTATTAATIAIIANTLTKGSAITTLLIVVLNKALIITPPTIGKITICTMEINIPIGSTSSH